MTTIPRFIPIPADKSNRAHEVTMEIMACNPGLTKEGHDLGRSLSLSMIYYVLQSLCEGEDKSIGSALFVVITDHSYRIRRLGCFGEVRDVTQYASYNLLPATGQSL